MTSWYLYIHTARVWTSDDEFVLALTDDVHSADIRTIFDYSNYSRAVSNISYWAAIVSIITHTASAGYAFRNVTIGGRKYTDKKRTGGGPPKQNAGTVHPYVLSPPRYFIGTVRGCRDMRGGDNGVHTLRRYVLRSDIKSGRSGSDRRSVLRAVRTESTDIVSKS